MSVQDEEFWKVMKENYLKSLSEIDIEDAVSNANHNDTVTLYHGTTTAHLMNILLNGIRPRIETNFNNWKHNPSFENLTYLTNKWHYFYAFNATNSFMDDKYGEEYLENHPDLQWWVTGETLPCYVECKIPKSLLVADEDFFASRYFVNKLKSAVKKGKDLTYDWMECLSQYGTVGVLGGVKPEYIVSFTVMADIRIFHEYFLDDNSQYVKEYKRWQLGKGKGKMTAKDLMKIEMKSDYNGTWWIKDLPSDLIGIKFAINQSTNKISMQYTRASKLGKSKH